MTPRPSLRHAALPLVLALTGCASAMIPGTMLKDTPDNRAIRELFGRYESAYEARDPQAILALVDDSYRDPLSNLDRSSLEKELVGDASSSDVLKAGLFTHVREARLDIDVKRVELSPKGDKATVDVFFDAAYLTNASVENSGRNDPWTREANDQRLVLVRKPGGWRIQSGL